MNRLQEKYEKEVLPALMKEFGLSQPLAISRPTKVVVNVGINRRDGSDAQKTIDSMVEQLMTITGQKPKLAAARKSIAGFKIRQGDTVGLTVTLRGTRMWEFLDKVISIVLPRVKDFQGVPHKVDESGNYSLGMKEQIVFPEIEYDKINKIMGLQMTIVSTKQDARQSLRMLELLGVPFEKEGKE